MTESLPIYPVLTYPDRPGILLPAIGEAYSPEDVSRAIADEGYVIREDLEPVASDRPGGAGWYVFVEGEGIDLGASLGARKKTKKPEPEKPKSRKATKTGPRRRKKGGSRPEIKKFLAKGFNLKKMPLAVATQLIFQQIWPDAYAVSQDYPKPEFGPDAPAWFAQMDWNPHLFMNVEAAMEHSRDAQNGEGWKELAYDCGFDGVAPYQPLYLYAQDNHGHGPSMERQIMENFDFPVEAHTLLVSYERTDDDEPHDQLWEEYLNPYFETLASILNSMMTPEMTGYFHFIDQPESEQWGLHYEECSDLPEGAYEEHYGAQTGGGDDDEGEGDDAELVEPGEPEEPVGGDLKEP